MFDRSRSDKDSKVFHKEAGVKNTKMMIKQKKDNL
jgi:hypothetical protein